MQTTSTDTYPIPTEEELKKIIESQCQKIANLGKSLDEQDHKCEFQHEKYSFLEASIDSIKREASCIKMNNVKYRRRMNKLISKSKPPPDYTVRCISSMNKISPIRNNSCLLFTFN
ncbi:hypothetical protein DFJ63DRAFT_311689 [Scheffersomyces coipomensis]|uniref:uncharacterized protein n=1 Tax=Scheffersomyces coipomensis TaxID=1788519 RepID=UPI00315D6F61